MTEPIFTRQRLCQLEKKMERLAAQKAEELAQRRAEYAGVIKHVAEEIWQRSIAVETKPKEQNEHV